MTTDDGWNLRMEVLHLLEDLRLCVEYSRTYATWNPQPTRDLLDEFQGALDRVRRELDR